MADDPTKDQDQGGTETEPDWKALYEEQKAEADKWKANSRKNEDRAKSNAGAAKGLEEATQKLAELSDRLAAIEGENEALKAREERAGLVAKVSKDTGLPEALVGMLSGTDEDTLAEQAKAFAAIVPKGAPLAPEAGPLANPGAGGADWLRDALTNR